MARVSDEAEELLLEAGVEVDEDDISYKKSKKSKRGSSVLSYHKKHPTSTWVMVSAFSIIALIFWLTPSQASDSSQQQPQESCDSVSQGYQCQPSISHSWGQYSPYFNVPSEISPEIPAGCSITFAQVLSRHGARDPSQNKSGAYARTIHNIITNVKSFDGDYAFLANYNYSLGADQLTLFGEHQLLNSGIDFFTRYQVLANTSVPFIRASGQRRVVESAKWFAQGFHDAKTSINNNSSVDPQYPYPVIVISEAEGSNNTLSHGLCPAFKASKADHTAQSTFSSTFIPNITSRLNANLPGANLTGTETIHMMDLCPFETVAGTNALGSPPSPFCTLFSTEEWVQYDYFQTLGKYYGHGPGSPFGATQGVGYVNELIARLTSSPVKDHTSTNSSLDTDPHTFPLGRSLYADFSHDNDMTSIFAALRLYNSTPKLNIERVMSTEEMSGYSAARTVPFAGRAVVEKMVCNEASVLEDKVRDEVRRNTEEEMVRVIMNGRVLPLETCGGDEQGRCTLDNFIDSLSFARAGGRWEECFEEDEGVGSTDGITADG